MSYLVLARKYRPQSFQDMIGQGHVVRTLTNAIKQNRVAHAFLFTGARGVGKTSSARLLARSLNCQEGPTPEPCGGCAACREITAGTSVDVQEIDGASNNGVDQVRELRENARYLPSRDRHKIYIIDEVHMLSGAAFNALLKTLEEPPPHVKFIFATTEPHKIPVTILSRTQRFDFRRIPLSQIVARIEVILEAEGIVMSSAAAALVARQAEGSMRDALSLLDQVISASGSTIEDELVEEILGVIDRTEVASLASALMNGDGANVLEIVARVFDRGLDLSRLAEDLAWHLRNLLVMKVGGRSKEVIDVADHERALLDEQARGASSTTLSFLFDMVHGAIPEIGRAVQPRLVMEVALLKAIHMAPGVDIVGLVERLDEIASGLGPAAQGRPRQRSASCGSERGTVRESASTRHDGPGSRTPPPRSSTVPTSEPMSTSEPKTGEGAASLETASSPPATGGVFSALARRMEARAEEKARVEAREPSPPFEADEPVRPREPECSGVAEPVSLSVVENGAAGEAASAANEKTAPKAARRGQAKKGSPADGETSDGENTQRPSKGASSGRESVPRESSTGRGEAAPATRARCTTDGEPVRADGAAKGEPQLPRGDDPEAPLSERHAALVEAVTRLGRRPFIVSALEHARPLSITEEEMVLALPRGLYNEGLQGAANRRTLEALVEDHFGSPLHVRIEVADDKKLADAPEAIAVLKERRLAEEEEAIRQEAMENAAVRLAVETLDGEIESIRILKSLE